MDSELLKSELEGIVDQVKVLRLDVGNAPIPKQHCDNIIRSLRTLIKSV